MTEFRPISLCNVIYNIGAKMIANRLKPCLDLLISPSQSKFVPKRLISDNVLVAFELNHYINTKPSKKDDFMTLKLDISKAYDRVEWSFLRKILLRFGLLPAFVDLIMLCVSSVSYSYLLNGVQFGELRPGRGLRQGDPLSPYLFICIVEAFVGLVDRAARDESIHGIKIAPSAPVITNLCFADDTMLFCRATEDDARGLKHILDTYAAVSGQVINYDKSSVAFSKGTATGKKNRVVQILGVQEVEKHAKYLGMPAVVGRSKKEIFSHLRDRIWKKMNGWGERFLSAAGKEIMIKSVLQSIPSYIMGCFLLPKDIVNKIESAIRSFWWGQGQNKKVAWISWRKLCTAKRQGGMGFRDLRSFNLALLAKNGWRILNNPESLVGQIF